MKTIFVAVIVVSCALGYAELRNQHVDYDRILQICENDRGLADALVVQAYAREFVVGLAVGAACVCLCCIVWRLVRRIRASSKV